MKNLNSVFVFLFLTTSIAGCKPRTFNASSEPETINGQEITTWVHGGYEGLSYQDYQVKAVYLKAATVPKSGKTTTYCWYKSAFDYESVEKKWAPTDITKKSFMENAERVSLFPISNASLFAWVDAQKNLSQSDKTSIREAVLIETLSKSVDNTTIKYGNILQTADVIRSASVDEKWVDTSGLPCPKPVDVQATINK